MTTPATRCVRCNQPVRGRFAWIHVGDGKFAVAHLPYTMAEQRRCEQGERRIRERASAREEAAK